MNTQTSQDQKFEWKQIALGLKTIYRYTKEFKKDLYIIFFFIIASSTIEALNPYIWGRLLDSIATKKYLLLAGIPVLEVFILIAVYTFLYALLNFSDLAKSVRARWVEENTRMSYLTSSFLHVYNLPMVFHKTAKQGETNEKIRGAAQSVKSVFSQAILESIPSITTAFIMCFVVLITNFYFGLIIICGLAIYIYISIKEIGPTFKLERESQKGYRKAGGMMQDAMTNIKAVKDSNTEKYETDRILNTFRNEGFSKWYQSFKIRRKTSSIQGYIRLFMRSFIISLSVFYILDGRMTLGEMVALVSYSMLIFTPLINVFNNWRDIQDSIITIDTAEKILQTPAEIYNPKKSDLHPIFGNIDFKNVNFYYDKENPVLKNINFNVSQGETIALVGESGVGKSTLIDLLSAYHFAKEGEVLMDGIDMREINLSTLRKNIAVVSQEISLFNDTIKYNLSYGSFDKTDEEIKEAARKAHCTDFIEKFPEKWDQVVGEKGLKLSVGQKQRVAIARAILKDPKILILDEPTSALDAGSEKIITESFKELMKGKTTFIIAHRLSTVREADTILVFKSGEIVERGKHTELIKLSGGEYRRLYELQIGLHS